ncbi:hypothetical protein [Aquipseudomonas guryensis]|uniref:Uncharacterized protein n=1 Tax=Aquipseudomonas guryensis TaxID=2759165 RepID=A0A7W4H396_9GAMM|nr:hypothetical protein [Pseudomonas guryensis]MBB1519295.1 hypothetical protein [Pseudomonas guryensis]
MLRYATLSLALLFSANLLAANDVARYPDAKVESDDSYDDTTSLTLATDDELDSWLFTAPNPT